MNCEICSKKVASTFLSKVVGTYVKDSKGAHAICFECQKRFSSKADMLQQIK